MDIAEKQTHSNNDNNIRSNLNNHNNNPRLRKLRSLVWNDFTKLQREDGSYVAICNHCSKQLTASSRSGTTHLKNHLSVCLSTRQIKRKKLVVRRLLPKAAAADVQSEDSNAATCGTSFDQESSRQDLAHMVLMHGYPFTIVQHGGFRAFVRNLQPHFRLPSAAEAVKLDCMKIYESLRMELHGVIGKVSSRVSLTVEMWKSIEDASYLCLACHYVDGEWKLQKKILNFLLLESPFAGEEIGKVVLGKMKEWDIEEKLFGVVLDNCCEGDVVAKELVGSLKGLLRSNGDLFQARSCCHLMNVVVQESLQVVSDVVNRVRTSVQFVKSSQERLLRFQNASRLLGIPEKALVLDIPTDWPSVYLMLETACQFQDVFTRLAECDMEFTEFLLPRDWNAVRAISECLELIYHAMEKFSDARIPTSNLYFNDICGIHLLLKTWNKSVQPLVAAMSKVMLEKFEQYWAVSRMLMAMSSILDPRYKMKSVEYFFKQIYDDSYEAKRNIDHVRISFTSLYNDYVVQYANSSNKQAFFSHINSSNTAESGIEGDVKTSLRIALSDTRRGLDQYLQETSSGERSRSDLDIYLEESVDPSKESQDDNFEILAWWKYNAAKYPVLSLMARDILAVPVSVVPLDSEARTLNPYLSSTDPLTAQWQICAQDWLADEMEAMDAFALIPASVSLEATVNADDVIIPSPVA